jgi:hypothetical protein
MPRIALALLTGFVLSGCHGSESCRLRHENAELRRENATLRAETKKLIEENQALRIELRDEDEDDDDNIVDVELVESPTGKVRDLMDPFPTRDESAADLLRQAQDAYVHGRYAWASANAYQAVLKGEPAKGWRLIGASACFQKDREAARKALRQLDATGKQFIKYVCGRNGVSLDKNEAMGLMTPRF